MCRSNSDLATVPNFLKRISAVHHKFVYTSELYISLFFHFFLLFFLFFCTSHFPVFKKLVHYIFDHFRLFTLRLGNLVFSEGSLESRVRGMKQEKKTTITFTIPINNAQVVCTILRMEEYFCKHSSTPHTVSKSGIEI